MVTWSFEQGTPLLKDLLEEYGIVGTFYTQATAIERFPDLVCELDRFGHHVGCHGYNHENYGGKPVKVWTKSQPVYLSDNKIKEQLLQKCIDIHFQVLNKHPETFVAPFDNINEDLLLILDDLGFKVDCSFHNYSLGLNSFPFFPIEGKLLVEIPLTVLQMGTDVPKNLLEAFAYNPELAEERLNTYVKSSLENYPFCMVLITCHPYEFLDVKIPHPREVLIVGDEKVNALNRLIRLFQEMEVEFLNPLQIVQKIKENGVQGN
jgi:peptidoglycan/xylan/chitin deacetylase (PgdA/CDA1 family)